MSTDSPNIWPFHGGLRLKGNKDISTQNAIQKASLPDTIVLPIRQHIGIAGDILIKPGDQVFKGQPLTGGQGTQELPVHAPTSGKVMLIEKLPVVSLSPEQALCITIETDGKDDWGDARMPPLSNYRDTDKTTLLKRISHAGIAGLGGAVFPTARKLGSSAKINTLIINAMECEPYITSDDMLMREQSSKILQGIDILMSITAADRCMIGIEDNKPEAIQALKAELKTGTWSNIDVVVTPTLYPGGGEKQLIQLLTGKEVPGGGLPADIGIICQNIGTAKAVYDAVIDGIPLIERVVTVTGNGVKIQGNYLTLIGTRIIDLINQTGGYSDDQPLKHTTTLKMGGPVMGIPVHNDTAPVVKATNCLLSLRDELNAPKQKPCIRCGECVKVCPAVLLPQQLYWHAKADDHEKLKSHNLFDCIECGCCNIVCPSHIPLVDYYRYAKDQIRQETAKKVRSDKARERHEFRLQRKEKAERLRQERLANKKALLKNREKVGTVAGKQSDILAALERVKQKKQAAKNPANDTSTTAKVTSDSNTSDGTNS